MAEIPLQPAATVRYDTTAHRREMFDGPSAVPYRFNWRAVHGAQLAADFKHALKRLEGLFYVVWGGQPLYAESKQWYAREHPRCRWGPEQWWQQPHDDPPPAFFWNYLETAARGELYAGATPAGVPVRSRSGDPAAQFKRSNHEPEKFPFGSVERYCTTPGNTGHAVHDPASTFQQFAAWPDAQDVVIRYTRPAGAAAVVAAEIVHTGGSVTMTEVETDIWEATIDALTQKTLVEWYVRAKFADYPDNWLTDPLPNPLQSAPQFRSLGDDPEHERAPGDCYSFWFFSHYNPYENGLPELLDQNEPHEASNWLRRGTDEYRFDSSENIDPGLINLARFVLDHTARRFQHNPRNRGGGDNCCVDMPIEFRWSGSNRPDLYRAGGKGGASGTQPLHNNPIHGNAGDEDARKSWRGIEMAWRSADSVPGYFPDNWYYGDTESWLTWPEQLLLDPDPGNPPFEAIVRSYGDRGLAPGDAIDPVHLQEIIDAVDYLIDNGLWTTIGIHTAKLTLNSAWGKPCGKVEFGHHAIGDEAYCVNADEDNEFEFPGCTYKCCASCPGGECVPFDRPTWSQCQSGEGSGSGWSAGKCYQQRTQYHQCLKGPACSFFPTFIGPTCEEYSYNLFTNCGIDPVDIPDDTFNGANIGRNCLDQEYLDPETEDCVCRTVSCDGTTWTYGSAYYLCGPPRCVGGPDGDHGNGLIKPRYDQDLNFAATGPSMGNCFGDMEACAELDPSEPDPPDFETVVAVRQNGIGGPWWNDQFPCQPGTMETFHRAAAIPGLGFWNYEHTDHLSYVTDVDHCADVEEPPSPEFCDAGCVLRTTGLSGRVGSNQFPVCRGDAVFVAIDLNVDEEGIPRLRDYDLGIGDPFDDCPCQTWTGEAECA